MNIPHLNLGSRYHPAWTNVDFVPTDSWMRIELLDQVVRNRPGGYMLPCLKNDANHNIKFILRRCGAEPR